MGGVVILFIVITFIFLALGLRLAQGEGHHNEIHNRIEEMGGEVSNIEKVNFFTGLGPFMVVGKGRTVYKVEYRIRGEDKEGWVRFGGILGPDWRL